MKPSNVDIGNNRCQIRLKSRNVPLVRYLPSWGISINGSLWPWTAGREATGCSELARGKSAGRAIDRHGQSRRQPQSAFSSTNDKKSYAPHSSRQRQQHTASPVKATAIQATPTAHTEDTRLQQYFRQDDDGRENQGHRGRDGKDAEEQGTPRPYKCAHC
jgi:hypothetical protein